MKELFVEVAGVQVSMFSKVELIENDPKEMEALGMDSFPRYQAVSASCVFEESPDDTSYLSVYLSFEDDGSLEEFLCSMKDLGDAFVDLKHWKYRGQVEFSWDQIIEEALNLMSQKSWVAMVRERSRVKRFTSVIDQLKQLQKKRVSC